MIQAVRQHWPEYLIEAWALGTFMVAALAFTALLEHPAFPLRGRIRHPLGRRAVMGLAMGLTLTLLVYSPWGRQSGAHLNPATTLTFLRLGKIPPWDAFFYVLAQFAGGLAGVGLGRLLFGTTLGHPHVAYAATVPGARGPAIAFLAEWLMAAVLMTTVLVATNQPAFAPYTGVLAGMLVCLFITVEAPLSGMSLNPARTLSSALPSRTWNGIWIYFTAPFLGMLLAAQAYSTFAPRPPRACPKLQHSPHDRCIFCGQDVSSTHSHRLTRRHA